MNEKGLLLYEIEECQKKLDNIILKENKNKIDLLYEQAKDYIGKYYLTESFNSINGIVPTVEESITGFAVV